MSNSWDLRDCSLPGSSVHGILQVRILEWVAIPFSREIFPTQGSNLGLVNYIKIRREIENIEIENIKLFFFKCPCKDQKDLHDPDNHDGVITRLEADIQECNIK